MFVKQLSLLNPAGRDPAAPGSLAGRGTSAVLS